MIDTNDTTAPATTAAPTEPAPAPPAAEPPAEAAKPPTAWDHFVKIAVGLVQKLDRYVEAHVRMSYAQEKQADAISEIADRIREQNEHLMSHGRKD